MLAWPPQASCLWQRLAQVKINQSLNQLLALHVQLEPINGSLKSQHEQVLTLLACPSQKNLLWNKPKLASSSEVTA